MVMETVRVILDGATSYQRASAMGISELKQDCARVEARIDALEATVWRVGLTVAGAAVLLDRFLDCLISK